MPPSTRHLAPGCATTDPRLTILCAVVAAFIYHYGSRLQLHHGLDDAMNAVPVHLYCGVWGLFFAALMYSPGRHDTLMRVYGIDESRGGCGRGDQVAANVAFAVVVLAWVRRCCADMGCDAHAVVHLSGRNPKQQNNDRLHHTNLQQPLYTK